MVDIFLIVTTVVSFVILLVVGVYLIVNYQHPDDKNEAWFPKLVVLLGFVLAGGSVLMVPLDVANNENYVGCDGYDTSICGGMPMETLWEIIFWAIPIWIFVLIPFATFYYEADDGMLMVGAKNGPAQGTKPKSKIMSALCYMVMVLVIVGVLFFVTYLLLSDTRIPVQEYEGVSVMSAPAYRAPPRRVDDNGTGAGFMRFDRSVLENMTAQDSAYFTQTTSQQNPNPDIIVLQVKISTFYAGLMAWFGWFFFALFGGIGLASLPLDLVIMYTNRPRHLDPKEFADLQLSIRERTNELVDIGELIKIERQERANLGLQSTGLRSQLFNREKRREAMQERQAILGFKQAVYLLEQDVEDFQNCHANWKKYNPLIPYIALFFGIVSAVLTLFWFIHICIYVLPRNPPTPFLNSYFEWFDGWFPLFGVLSVSIFSIYLMFAAVKGCFKFGLRFICFALHPMKPNKTYMSSFMFNIGLVLLCTLPIIQFVTVAFSDYARYSTIKQVFGVQIYYLRFFTFFWVNDVFVYALVILFVLTVFYLFIKPKDQSTSSVKLRDRLRGRG